MITYVLFTLTTAIGLFKTQLLFTISPVKDWQPATVYPASTLAPAPMA